MDLNTLIHAAQGRPCAIRDDGVLVISHEDGVHAVTVAPDADNLEEVIRIAIIALDSLVYPERERRLLAAARALRSHVEMLTRINQADTS